MKSEFHAIQIFQDDVHSKGVKTSGDSKKGILAAGKYLCINYLYIILTDKI